MSGESAMKNAIARRAHRERSQPTKRKKLGLLEKHKDYVERSKDYKKKQSFIKTLKKKASERNPDEFYFKMHDSKVTNGFHTKLVKNLDNDTIKLLKTQDLGYIIHKKAVDDHKIEKLQKNLHMIGRNSGSSAHKHKIFVDNIAEVESFDPTSRMKSSTPSSSALTKASFEQLPPEIATKSAKKAKKILTKVVEKKMKNSYKELEQRQQRAKQLGTALHALSLQRHLLGKGSKRKVVFETNRAGDEEDGEESDGKKVVFKWKRERQK